MAAIDEHTVVSAFISVDNLHAPSRQSSTAAIERYQVRKRPTLPRSLPTEAQAVVLLDLSFVTEFAQLMLATVLGHQGSVFEFPASPPVGLALKISSAGVDGETIIAGDTLDAIGQFLVSLRNKRSTAD